MENLIKSFGLIIAVWFITTGSAPIQWIKKALNIHSGTNSDNLFILAISKLFNCSLCLGFWCGLAYYQDILYACVFSLACEIFYRIVKKVF